MPRRAQPGLLLLMAAAVAVAAVAPGAPCAAPAAACALPCAPKTDPLQCLHFLQESHKDELCGRDLSPGRRRAALANLRLRHCCEHRVAQALPKAAFHDTRTCRLLLQELLEADDLAAQASCSHTEVLRRYDCAQNYSIAFHCEHCKSSRQKSISSYFIPAKRKKVDEVLPLTSQTVSQERNEVLNAGTHSLPIPDSDVGIGNLDSETPSSSKNPDFSQLSSINVNISNDVGNFVGQKIDNMVMKKLLENPWTPPKNYTFPFSSRIVSGKQIKNYVSYKHLDSHKEWLVLSDVKKGLFCKYCPWFTPHNQGGYRGITPLGVLVTQPLTDFKNLVGIKSVLEVHSQNKYHKNAMTSGKDFLRDCQNPQRGVHHLLDKSHYSQIQENRKRLIPIVKTIMFSGRQNIPLRGHRDDGAIKENTTPQQNEGNFRALLRFRIDSGDTVLAHYLENTSSRATYISKTIQNQLIECCRAEILDRILQKVAVAEFYTLVFDESPDLSGKAQVSLVLRYVDFSSGGPCVREDFVTFLDAFDELSRNNNAKDTDSEESEDEDLPLRTAAAKRPTNEELSLTGSAIGGIVLRDMKKMNLRMEKCAAIGTDGCAVMLSDIGAVNEIRKVAKNAVMTPCFSHKLNNSISKSVKIRLIESVSNAIREVDKFFKNSYPKRTTVLAKILGEKLVQLCETRWVERHDAVLQFATKLPLIIEALLKISEWKNRETAGKATILISALCKFEFIVGLFCLCDILSLTHSLSVVLQKETIDLAKASKMVDTLLATLKTKREKADEKFRLIYSETKKMAEKLDVKEEKPRTCGRQTKRENYDANTCEDYYRISVYIPLLDTIKEDLEARFSSEVLDAFQLSLLLPEKVTLLKENETDDLIDCLIERFGNLLDDEKTLQRLRFRGELSYWQCYWEQQQKLEGSKIPTSAVETLKNCDVDIYPTIHTYFRVFCTLPVTNASSERSFSYLRRIKTWLRTTMLQERLVGLALLHTHHDIEITAEDVIERFAKLGRHRFAI